MKAASELGNLLVVAAKGTTQELGLTAMNPRANIMRTEDDATAATAYITGQADLFATNSLIVPDLLKRAPKRSSTSSSSSAAAPRTWACAWASSPCCSG